MKIGRMVKVEIELKYRVEQSSQWEALLKSQEIAEHREGEMRQKTMLAIYYDTEEQHLRRLGAAYRVRLEGDRYVATVKWQNAGEQAQGAKSRRLEWNVTQPDERPDPTAFERGPVQSGDDLDQLAPLLSLLKEHELREMGRTDFVRRFCVVNWQGMRAELCLDQGRLYAKEKQSPIQELELELLEGSEESIQQLGERLARRYQLKPEPRSKYARVLMLLDGKEVE